MSEAPVRDADNLHRGLDAIWGNPRRGFARLTIVNHTIVGQRFMLTGLFFFLVGGVLAMLIRAQLATSGNDFVGHEAYNQIFTMHGTVMMFLFAVPMLEGFAALPAAQDARRARPRLPPSQRLRLLVLPVRRFDRARLDPVRRGAGRRMVHVHAAFAAASSRRGSTPTSG